MPQIEALETLTHNGHTIEIHASEAESPRDWDNLGTFWTMDRRYNSPDKMPRQNIFESMAKVQGMAQTGTAETIEKRLVNKAIWFPVWKYEHSGVAYRAAASNPFSCRWDSGQVGWIFVLKSDLRKAYNVKRLTAKIRGIAAEILQSEVFTYSQWANGEVYSYTITDAAGNEVDSCGGFIGWDDVIESAKAACGGEVFSEVLA